MFLKGCLLSVLIFSPVTLGICRNDCKHLQPLYETIPCVASPNCNNGSCARAYHCPFIDNWPPETCYFNKKYYKNGETFSIPYTDTATSESKSCLHRCEVSNGCINIQPVDCPSPDVTDFSSDSNRCADNIRFQQELLRDYSILVYTNEKDVCPLMFIPKLFAPPWHATEIRRTCKVGDYRYKKWDGIAVSYNSLQFSCYCDCPPFIRCIKL
ncbi:hypothetical protein RI129_009530 [Pyrocoelia pectoralis]|uniref:Uncharacterized protein n=1 Tax=Pyrocoelia pectoralis TaxID=417401 RepID=A0AAN7V8K0_9COLE